MLMFSGHFITIQDFRKAFDLVSHKHFLYKLSKYGIKGHVLNWITAFLSHRIQKAVIRGSTTDEYYVTGGVPQGSVFGQFFSYYS